ncbi:MAG: hypothetical protein Q9213_003096 [Squamulea squamosa]
MARNIIWSLKPTIGPKDTEPVNFVSAGNSVPDRLLDPAASPSAPSPEAIAHSSIPQVSLASMTIEDQDQEVSDGHNPVQELGAVASTTPEINRDGCQREQDLFFMDGTGLQANVKLKFPSHQLPRSPSPTLSNSSDEVIVFTGRRAAQRNVTQQNKNQSETQSQRSNHLKPESDDRNVAEWGSNTQSLRPIVDTTDRRHPQAQHNEDMLQTSKSPIAQQEGDDSTILTARSRRRRQKRNMSAKQSRSQAVEDEILADYIANMADEDVLNETCNGVGHDESLAENPPMMVAPPSETDSDAAGDAIQSLANQTPNWDSNDIRDFDDMSTSAEAYTELDRVLASRHRPAGQQYLVVGQNQSIDDARWIPLSSLTSSNARESIRAFELTRAEFQIGSFSSEDSDDSTDEAQLSADLRDDLDSIEDERDLVERRQARMTDEHIARLLSKQEELGLDSHELLLFDGADDDDEEEEEEMPPAAFVTLEKARTKKSYRPHGEFPSATLFADQFEQNPYGDFDVMDHDRLSLRKKPKGRRGGPTFDLSDIELEASLQSAWEKDRLKKKIRKQEREELRAQGLLSKTGQPNLNAKYKEGITLYEVREEIIVFMTSSRQSLALPSMSHRDRKIVHEMAHLLKLKSQSNGEGKSRYPSLYKTARTSEFNEDTMSTIMTQLNSKRFLPRVRKDRDNKGSGKAAAVKRGRGGNAGKTAGVTYMDGEVVGAAAPEIGIENRGRAMLEKMGWSKGTALGAMNNKGMLMPVTHIVKTTKAGLG